MRAIFIRKPIRRRRSKLRPGRLRGRKLAELRDQCWARDLGLCDECGRPTYYDVDPIRDDSYHMAHIKAKRIGGDNLNNVRTLCGCCHRNEHNAGGKPVPKKARELEATHGE